MHRLALAWMLCAACANGNAGSDASPAPADAAPGRADSAPRAGADTTACLDEVPADWGTPTPVDTNQYQFDGDYTFIAELVEQPFQKLFISLHPMTGVFPGAVAAGTYTLEGNETDFSWCGSCVYLAVDDGDTPSTLYMAQSGTLRIDTVGAEIHGELLAANLLQIDITYTGQACGMGEEKWPCGNSGCSSNKCGEQIDVPACGTHITSLSF